MIHVGYVLPLLYHWRELPQLSFLSRQTGVCLDKHVFVETKHVFCRDKIMFVETIFLRQIFCRNKHVFFATSILLSRQKTYFVPTKLFVSTKMILMVAPASDRVGDRWITEMVGLGKVSMFLTWSSFLHDSGNFGRDLVYTDSVCM